MRWAGVLISGMLGGLGGIVFITAGVSEWRFEYGVAGFGFLALAVMIFGQWKPTRIALAPLLFGLFRALSNVYTPASTSSKAMNIPSAVYNMMPYIISLVVLALHVQEVPRSQGRGYPLRQGPALTHSPTQVQVRDTLCANGAEGVFYAVDILTPLAGAASPTAREHALSHASGGGYSASPGAGHFWPQPQKSAKRPA